jgi:hypothetical protein
LALKDSHPSDWIEDQLKVHELFANMLDLEDDGDELISDEAIEELDSEVLILES